MKRNMRKNKHWSKSENGIKAFLQAKEVLKEERKKERERLKKIRDFEENENVILSTYNNEILNEKVLKIYDKTYKISLGKNDYVLIDKDSLTGYANSLIKDVSGDGRRFVGSSYSLLKKNK